MADPIHVMHASPVRRTMALGIQVVLGALLLWVALAQPPEALAWRVFLLVLGAGALWLGVRGWRDSTGTIELHDDGLRGGDGTVIAPLEAIASIDRGLFAFKPSNGFILRLNRSMPRAWSPGLWWRVGRRVGVGGVTSSVDARIVADALSAMVARR
ncbi:hypothetical protein [Jannaschia sp. LMIT008]|uniref:hypothetical protein n=1 Tax=Jannaschia maritima TaxID=3032585 RepID=UPI0028126DD2|nr:hypothetical protein [Jannaschia sp. LMIT008]